MRKSYCNETTMTVNMVIELNEVQGIIEVLSKVEDPDYKVADLLKSMKKVKREAAVEALRTFQDMADAD
jgi:NACalpha-BTF3-like transcription factor